MRQMMNKAQNILLGTIVEKATDWLDNIRSDWLRQTVALTFFLLMLEIGAVLLLVNIVCGAIFMAVDWVRDDLCEKTSRFAKRLAAAAKTNDAQRSAVLMFTAFNMVAFLMMDAPSIPQGVFLLLFWPVFAFVSNLFDPIP